MLKHGFPGIAGRDRGGYGAIGEDPDDRAFALPGAGPGALAGRRDPHRRVMRVLDPRVRQHRADRAGDLPGARFRSVPGVHVFVAGQPRRGHFGGRGGRENAYGPQPARLAPRDFFRVQAASRVRIPRRQPDAFGHPRAGKQQQRGQRQGADPAEQPGKTRRHRSPSGFSFVRTNVGETAFLINRGFAPRFRGCFIPARSASPFRLSRRRAPFPARARPSASGPPRRPAARSLHTHPDRRPG